MPKCPHLHRRHNTLYFRLSVPVRFQSILHVRELTQSLHTQNHKEAIPAAYKLAGEAKTLFLYLDAVMTDKDEYEEMSNDFLLDVLKDIEKEERKQIASLPTLARRIIEEKEIAVKAARQRERQAELQVKADAFDKLQSISVRSSLGRQEEKRKSDAPMLSVVFKSYVDQYKGDGSKGGRDYLFVSNR